VEKDIQSERNFLDFPPRKTRLLPQPIKSILPRNMGLIWEILLNLYKLGKHKI
jgi:hypothetical protein